MICKICKINSIYYIIINKYQQCLKIIEKC